MIRSRFRAHSLVIKLRIIIGLAEAFSLIAIRLLNFRAAMGKITIESPRILIIFNLKMPELIIIIIKR